MSRHPVRIERAALTGTLMDDPDNSALPTHSRSADEPGARSRRTRRQNRIVDGILLLDKPSGSTSNRVLQQVKRMYQARKAGHTGSLDPLASGMLPLCFGQATKVSTYLLDADKEYRVKIAFGAKTDTADADGQVIEDSALKSVEPETLQVALDRFRGQIEQIPPMYSALKKDGKRLYELARRGEEVVREPRRVVIHELVLEEYDPRHPVLRVRCSKGTYIRTLVEDIAATAGSLGHVAELRRLRVSSFLEQDMITLAELEGSAAGGLEALDGRLLPADRALGHLPAISLDEQRSRDLLQGQPARDVDGSNPGLVRVYDSSSRFLGIGELLEDGRLAPKRLFTERAVSAAD